ncbi:MAG: hypothetical protein LBG06_06755 [Deltaproteobacteria bacterium]|nr:hypothetical protein [Deltaproteobacteria bacterium]
MPVIPEFYEPEKRVPSRAPLIAAAAAAVSCAIAPAYAMLTLYMPLDYADPAFLAAFALATGWTAWGAAYCTRTHCRLVAALYTLAGAWIGFYLSWSIWLGHLAYFQDPSFPGFGRLLEYMRSPRHWSYFALHPSELYDAAEEVDRLGGGWSFGEKGSEMLKGSRLLAFWITEFVLFSVLAVWKGGGAVNVPFSADIGEDGEYLPKVEVVERGFASPDDLDQLASVCGGLGSGDLTYFIQAPLVPGGMPGFFLTFRFSDECPWGTVDVDVVRCGGRYFTLKRYKVVRNVKVPLSFLKSLKARLA